MERGEKDGGREEVMEEGRVVVEVTMIEAM